MGWDDIADDAANETDNELSDQELTLLANTSLNWEQLKPDNVDEDTYSGLIQAVSDATARNESILQLKSRIMALGSGAIELAKTISTRLP